MTRCPFHHPASDGGDPFKTPRESAGVLHAEFQDRPVPMILTHRGVRDAARDWRTYSSDAPVRVPIPSEEDVRSVRQLPLEVDPPSHSAYRRLAETFFDRPKDPAMIRDVETLIDRLIDKCLARTPFEAVQDFAIPLQSHALALLLNAPPGDAELWIGWGTHVFRDKDGRSKSRFLEDYCLTLLNRAEAEPRYDFFTALTRMEFDGRKLTREEQLSYLNIVFAGGRDTIIHTVTGVFGHLAAHAEVLDALRANPALINPAAEGFSRILSPVTHLGRVAPAETEVGGARVEPGERIPLCWASANRDASVFPGTETVKLDRKPNPHLAFGSGPHTCLGALHARLLTRPLLARHPSHRGKTSPRAGTRLRAQPRLQPLAAWFRARRVRPPSPRRAMKSRTSPSKTLCAAPPATATNCFSSCLSIVTCGTQHQRETQKLADHA